MTATASSDRVTVFHMFGEVFAYTTRSESPLMIGEVGIIGVLDPNTSPRLLWHLAEAYCRERDQTGDHARWLVNQATRARVVGSGRLGDLRKSEWKFSADKRYHFGRLYSNHMILRTGLLEVVGLDLAPFKERARAERIY
ncbi:hypothetical protein ACFQ7J_06675 [Streptomyces sp. NPDC056501]|uniref:hypothetical protein n=1 Tax=Streptomyces sp. NPDC056501 TaxID=3345841 RepID=UPI0036BA3077